MIDLYYNDCVSLENTLDYITKNQSQQLSYDNDQLLETLLSVSFASDLAHIQMIAELKHHLLLKNTADFKRLMNQKRAHIMEVFKDELLDFIGLLVPDPYYE